MEYSKVADSHTKRVWSVEPNKINPIAQSSSEIKKMIAFEVAKHVVTTTKRKWRLS